MKKLFGAIGFGEAVKQNGFCKLGSNLGMG